MFTKLYLGSDHGAVHVIERVKKLLEKQEIAYEDLGADDPDTAVDYPLVAKKVADAINKNPGSGGILACGSGTGMTIAANKIPGIRAGLAFDIYSAKMARYDNDANVLSLRGREFPIDAVDAIVQTWVTTEFSGFDRHKKRVGELAELEK